MGANQVSIIYLLCGGHLYIYIYLQALRDAAELLTSLVSLARSAQLTDPEEMCNLVKSVNSRFEVEMFPRSFGWVSASNRSAELDVATREGRAVIYLLYIVMSLAGCLSFVLEAAGLKRKGGPHM